jgi:hypothetical protein
VSAVCPNGHTSDAEDYCDTCGSPIDAAAQPAAGGGVGGGRSSLDLDPPPSAPSPGGAGQAAPASAPETLACPNCHTENSPGALFCEACGYDFTTGAMPRGSEPTGGDPAVAGAADGGGGGDGVVSPTDGTDGTDAGSPAAVTDDPSGAAGVPGPASPADPADPADTTDPTDTTDPSDAPGPRGPGDGGTAATAGAGSPASAPTGPGTTTGTTGFEWLAEVWVDPDWYQTQEADDPCPSPGLPTIMPLRHRSVLLGRMSTSRNTRPEIDLSSDPGVSRRHAQLTTDGSRWFVEDLGSSNGTFVGPASGPLPAAPVAVGPRTELDDDDRLYVGAWTRVVVRRATPDEVEAYG